MAGKTAIDGDPEEALFGAEIFVAGQTVAALAATDPREHGFPGADQALRNIRADFFDDARDFVTQRERQRHAAGGVELLAAAKIGITVLDMQIGMTQSAALDADENIASLRLRGLDDGFTQR